MQTELLIPSEFKERMEVFKKDFYEKYNCISKEVTPKVDGNGTNIIRKRPDGYDYIVESYMRDCLDRHFPGWSWEATTPVEFIGSEWVVVQGHLCIIDEHLIALGINPPIRKFFGIDSVRIQFKKNQPHTPENIIDVGDNCKQANTAALKYAINRLTHIGDDIYGKRIENEGAGSFEEVMNANPDSTNFMRWIDSHKIRFSEIFEILGVKGLTEITDYKSAMEKIKEIKGIK